MKEKSLYQQLNAALQLLEQRRRMIPNYINQEGWLGENHYSMDMIPPLDKKIQELKAAIRGIEEWRKETKRKKLSEYYEKKNNSDRPA